MKFTPKPPIVLALDVRRAGTDEHHVIDCDDVLQFWKEAAALAERLCGKASG